MILGAIKTILTSDPTINGIISGRAYPTHAEQVPTYPFITYQSISATRNLLHSGSSNVVERRIQITCFGSSLSQSTTLARAVTEKFHGLKTTVGDDKILLSSIKNEIEFYDEDAKTYYTAVDVLIYHNE